MEPIGLGARGNAVADIQRRLARLGHKVDAAGADGVFGPATEDAVRQFQRSRRLKESGSIDKKTWKRLVEATYKPGERLLYLRAPHFRGQDVRDLQKSLKTLGFDCGRADSVFGVLTDKALRTFQRETGVDPDGIVGPSTLRAFQNLRRIIWDADRKTYPKIAGQRATPSSILVGRRIIIHARCEEPGFPADQSAQGPNRILVRQFEREKRIIRDITLRLGNLLTLLGADVTYLSSWQQQNGPAETLAGDQVPSDAAADLIVCIQLGRSGRVHDRGFMVAYSNDDAFAQEAREAASFVLDEAEKLLSLHNRGMVGKAALLDNGHVGPQMVFEAACITNESDSAFLRDEAFRQKIAVAVFDGIKRFLDGSG